MSFVDQSRKPSPASMAAVIGIHAAIGAALVIGLQVSGTILDVINKIDARNIPDTVPPPPPPPVDDPEPNEETPNTQVYTPVPPLNFPQNPNVIDTTDIPLPIPKPIPQPGSGIELNIPKPTPTATFDPVGAKPRNDPSRWLSDRDYRPNWSRRELTGLARFRLEIAANGAITDCTVTGSTGHSELDTATCTLVTKRAKFEPARGRNGEPVAGSYNGAVMWTLPE